MKFFFVHAPPENGWEGALLLWGKRKSTIFTFEEVRRHFEKIYPTVDFNSCRCELRPKIEQIQAFDLRLEKGLWERETPYETREDLLFQEFGKKLLLHGYTELELLLRMFRP